ncbi:Molybdenum cofactor sulfurase (LOS5) (ABA3) isoform 1 [Tripterygium wilfordii]|uniref:Molybdenum cofactor sulfurase (LOS5) (ABA3) isoform 1 n=1 Tax=Tripterygium wilfordii TaxID=458696 RepID=A0A7J7CAZ7_TRIWF|nr:Molybdenum cofactor sulfurase (LOS5) (ABA3) isoform 1 [Tripterygium wilfordii]
MDKEEFLKEYGEYYGYPNGPKSIDEIRATEFKRLQNGTVYLDHAGATLYSELQMEAILKDLTSSVLEFFNASPRDYKCIFTSGAAAALKLVLSALIDSRYALSQGAAAFAIDIEEELHHSGICDAHSVKMSQHLVQRRKDARSLERDPTGLRFKLELVKIIKEDSKKLLESSAFSRGCWMILIDGAKGCATKPLDLSRCPADFVVISFYKLFGYPTGLGALIVRNDVSKLLKKKYFGGASIRYGFKILNSLTISAITRHTASLISYVKKTLLALKHENGASVCTLYGSLPLKVFHDESGPVVSFNLQRPDMALGLDIV